MSTQHQIVLRPAREDELERIGEIDRASFAQPWSPLSFASVFKDEKYLLLVAECEAEICGFGVAYTVGDEGEIATIAVDENFRGRGLGAKILQALCDFCAQRGAHTIFLEVRPSNQSARCLYKRFGFEQVGVRRGYYDNGEDAIIMRMQKCQQMQKCSV
jgi:ribosomal-protein-alanine N-acetyltransferase